MKLNLRFLISIKSINPRNISNLGFRIRQNDEIPVMNVNSLES